ncbi:unnamed protein product [Phytomonas sp. EM1]|nr:unnamed protein product [Phytomonas sp. EM1]|eukprot:CCW60963.1 unnamed protein product [Phytomonas sp. isolate EM1]
MAHIKDHKTNETRCPPKEALETSDNVHGGEQTLKPAKGTSQGMKKNSSGEAKPADSENSQIQEKEAKKLAEMRFKGQESENARASIKIQREIKKKKNALNKVQKKLKSLKSDEDEFAQTKGEEAQLLKEIISMEGDLQCETQKVSSAPLSTPSVKVSPLENASKPTSTAHPTDKVVKGEGAEVKEQQDVEEARRKLQELVKQAMQSNNHIQRKHFMPRRSVVHPRVAEVALMIEEMRIVGGNARTMATIYAFSEMLKCTAVLAGSSLKDVNTTIFEKLVEENFAFLRRKREASVGMHYVKKALLQRMVAARDKGSQLGDPREVALQLLGSLEAELCMSIKTIVEDRSLPYVSNQDTILVFGRSSVVEFILLSRVEDPQRRPKRVIVVDSGPLFEGRALAHKLSDAGIQVTYGLITASCMLIPKCTKVFIGASSVLQSGDVFSRCGTALVAACAKSFRKPVLCFVESYKFAAEVWIGNLAQNTKLVDIREQPSFNSSGAHSPLIHNLSPSRVFANDPQHRIPDDYNSLKDINAMHYGSSSASGYLYDLTPATYVDMIVCEMGCLHTSAIIAVIKDREGLEAAPLM